MFSESQEAMTFIGFSEMTKQRCSWAETIQEKGDFWRITGRQSRQYMTAAYIERSGDE